MSILDKLPLAPEGYKWSVRLEERGSHPEHFVTVTLGVDYWSSVPEVTVWGLTVRAEANEEVIMSAAEQILEEFPARCEEEKKRLEEREAYKAQFAHLLTE